MVCEAANASGYRGAREEGASKSPRAGEREGGSWSRLHLEVTELGFDQQTGPWQAELASVCGPGRRSLESWPRQHSQGVGQAAGPRAAQEWPLQFSCPPGWGRASGLCTYGWVRYLVITPRVHSTSSCTQWVRALPLNCRPPTSSEPSVLRRGIRAFQGRSWWLVICAPAAGSGPHPPWPVTPGLISAAARQQLLGIWRWAVHLHWFQRPQNHLRVWKRPSPGLPSAPLHLSLWWALSLLCPAIEAILLPTLECEHACLQKLGSLASVRVGKLLVM